MCYSPVHLPSGIDVPCGHCLACLKAYQDAWTARLNEELKNWKSGIFKPVVFFTLKYRDDTIPRSYLFASSFSGPRLLPASHDIPPGVPIYEEWTSLTKESRSDWRFRHSENLRRFAYYANQCVSDEPDIMEHAYEFHSVLKKDVQDWLKRGRVRLVRKFPETFAHDVNPRLKTHWINSDGVRLPLPSCSQTPTIKYFITSEYGPRTHRPHYHGVVFGVTYEEFKECFANDWKERFGDIDFSIYDPSRGSMLYLAKYCSKGGYEHPYCAKDFFYHDGEYHSKDYEKCIEDFGVNLPLVNPTFHLISKGIGVSYCFNKEIQNYFGARLEPYVSDSGRVNYRVSDSDTMPIIMPQVGLSESLYDSAVLDVEQSELGFIIRKYAYPSKKERENGVRLGPQIGESFIPYDAVVNSAQEQNYFSKKYNRVYHVPKKITQFRPSAWHLLNYSRETPATRVTSISLPRYYRRWLLSPLACALRSSAASVLYPDVHAAISGEMEKERPNYAYISCLISQLDCNEIRNKDTEKRLRKSAQDFYSKSQF